MGFWWGTEDPPVRGTTMTPYPDPAYTEGHINAAVSAGQDRDDLWRHEVPIQRPRDLRVSPERACEVCVALHNVSIIRKPRAP